MTNKIQYLQHKTHEFALRHFLHLAAEFRRALEARVLESPSQSVLDASDGFHTLAIQPGFDKTFRLHRTCELNVFATGAFFGFAAFP